jgi:deoxyadenosine/deoxycytidine kinase
LSGGQGFWTAILRESWTSGTSPSKVPSAVRIAAADQLARGSTDGRAGRDDNPFLADFYAERPGAGFQAQLFYTLARHRQQTSLRQRDLFSQLTICDYLFERDKIYAYLNLDDNELFIYQRLYELLAPDLLTPDLVVYLQAPTDVLRRRLRERPRVEGDPPVPEDRYVRELNEAYTHFFFHYSASPLLVVETSQFDLTWGEDAVADIERQIRGMGKGTRYYVPRA